MESYDVAIIGSGLTGSIVALLLSKLGYRTLMVEKTQHPRFALGESSTPVFGQKIRHLGRTYNVPELVQLSSYDRIKASKDPIMVGPKELFHYYVHQPGQTQAKINGMYPEVVVQTPEIDTQFLRAELDQRLTEYAIAYGSAYADRTELLDLSFEGDGVRLNLQKKESAAYSVRSQFVVDATGFRSLLSQKLNLRLADAQTDTTLRSRCIFTHFETVGPIEEAMGNDEAFNQRCSVNRWRGTQHHCFDGGWYWFIPFDNGVTSVGVNLDMDRYPMNDMPAEEEFWHFTRQYPMVNRMLEGRKSILPYAKTGRLQFSTRQAAGERWALLPASAVGMDAWFSTGMGMNLVSIHRLVEVLHTRVLPGGDFRREHFKDYEASLYREWYYITRMVDGMYKSFKHFEIFKSYCFFCFMGAESFIAWAGLKRPNDPASLMLHVGDPQFVAHFMHIYNKVLELNKEDQVSPEEAAYFRAFLQNEMKPYNFRDYGNPIYDGVHYRTSLPKLGGTKFGATAALPAMT